MKAVQSKITYKCGVIREIFPATGGYYEDAMLIFEDDSIYRLPRKNIEYTSIEANKYFVSASDGTGEFLTEAQFNEKYQWTVPFPNSVFTNAPLPTPHNEDNSCQN